MTKAAEQCRVYKRISLAAVERGVTLAFLKQLINQGRLTRYKLGACTMVDCNELDALVVADVGNHGPEAAPQGKRNGHRRPD
jgi:hypothetical protein